MSFQRSVNLFIILLAFVTLVAAIIGHNYTAACWAFVAGLAHLQLFELRGRD